jgi:lipid-binding SYLF domain-containing protein
MEDWSRRGVLAALAATTVAACNNGTRSSQRDVIDVRVRDAIDLMYAQVPDSRDLRDKASGMLMMPLVTEAGLGVGGAYGEGALLVGDAIVDYYSFVQGSFGLQAGAQQSAHALFFMTPAALAGFRGASGWTAGGDVQYALPDQGDAIGTSTTIVLSPVIAVVFGQQGLIAGATLRGGKYTRIVR